MSAKQKLKHGNEFPFDSPDRWRAPKDWAHSAARGVIAELLTQVGIGHELENIDEETRKEIVAALSEIIREASLHN